jgi:hypothetical protein
MQLLGRKQIPRANPALGMTVLEFFRSLQNQVDLKMKHYFLPFGPRSPSAGYLLLE